MSNVTSIATYRAMHRTFTFCEECPRCRRLVEPFVVCGKSTERYMCEGSIDEDDYHAPVHWAEHKNGPDSVLS